MRLVTGKTMLFDSHCHLTAAQFDEDRRDVIERARGAEVGGLVTVASTPEDARVGLQLARENPWIRSTAGVHPHEAASMGSETVEQLFQLLENPEVVAVGECGLDYYYDTAPRDIQRRVFDAQIEVAAETDLPLIIHSRSSDLDMEAALRSAPASVRGVLHCFTGSDALLDAALELGFYVSFTGIVTFRNFEGREQVSRVPADRLMIETDAPYLAPVPFRGKRNEPSYLPAVLARVAELRGEPAEEVGAYTTETALRFYGISSE